jgi:hypothetical protein
MKNMFCLSALVLQIKSKKKWKIKIKIMLKTKYKKKINGYPRYHMTHKFSQSHFRIQTRSQRCLLLKFLFDKYQRFNHLIILGNKMSTSRLFILSNLVNTTQTRKTTQNEKGFLVLCDSHDLTLS